MVGDIKAISPCVKSASAKLFLDLHTVSAPSGEERTLDTSAQVERAGRCCRCFDSGTQTRCGSATVMVLVSTASGPRVSGCTRAPRYFGPHPVRTRLVLPSLFPPLLRLHLYGLPYGFTVKSQMIPERSDDCFGLNSRCVAVENRCTTLYNCIAP